MFGNEERMKSEDGAMLVVKEMVKKSQTVYFEELLNVEEDRDAEILAIGRENEVNVLGGLNDSQITKEEVKRAIKMKAR